MDEFLKVYNSYGNMVFPHIFVEKDEPGCWGLFWNTDKLIMDMSLFEKERSYSYFCRLSSGEEFMSDSSPVSEPLPEKILKNLIIDC